MNSTMAKKERSPENIELGKRIKRVREEFADGIDQGRFAEPLGVSRQAVVQWENGKGAGRTSLLKIAREYKVSFEWLALNEGEPRGVSPPPIMSKMEGRVTSTEHAQLTGRLGELFAAILKADNAVQREAIEALEELVPSRQRTRVTKTNEQS